MFDKLHEECGVFGIYDKTCDNVATSAYLALYALQQRGQENCGIAVNDDGVIKCHKDAGLVPDVFNREVLEKLGQGSIAVGHCRYSTTGNSSSINAQPLVVRPVSYTHLASPMREMVSSGFVASYHVTSNISASSQGRLS